jgi:hypothetical protein
MAAGSETSSVLVIRKEVVMNESRLPEGPSVQELAERLGELLSDDEMEKIAGGDWFEFGCPDALV